MFPSIVATFCIAGVVSIGIFYWRQFQFWKKLGVPHSRPCSPFGDISAIAFVKSAGEVVRDLYVQGKDFPFFGVWYWFLPNLIIRDPELIKDILGKDFAYFHDRGGYLDRLRDPLSGHLFFLGGSQWRTLRQKQTPGFTSGRMKAFFPKLLQYAEDLKLLMDSIAEVDGVADMREVAARFTTDISTAYSLGIKADCLKKNNDAIWREMGRKVFETTLVNVSRSLLPPFIGPAAKLLLIPQVPPDVSRFFLSAFKEIIQFRRKELIKQNDFMQILQDLITDDEFRGDLNESWNFTYKEAAAQAYIFFIAGFETSSLTIQYALYEMALNQSVQDKLRSEIRYVLGKYDEKITYEALQEMTYLTRVIQETLRKYPVVPVIFRTCTQDYEIPKAKITLPKGTQVQISVYGLHRDPKYFEDPEKFDPERFANVENMKRFKNVYMPFGSGPRTCIGMRFSMLQKKVALVKLISNFKFKVCEKTPIPMIFHRNSFFFAPETGMHLQVLKLSYS